MNKKYLKYLNNFASLKGKTFVVTGANSGIGLSISKSIILKQGHLVMACRNLDKANEAKKQLLKINNDVQIDILLYDQSSFADIDRFVNELVFKYPLFDSIVLNAGLFRPFKDAKSKDNLPLTYAVNAFGIFYMLEKLKKAFNLESCENKHKIIIQGSLAAYISKYKNFQSLLCPKQSLTYQYNISKYICANAYFYYAINNINPNVQYLLCEPGISCTNIIRNFPNWFKKIGETFLKIFCHDNDIASLTCYHLLASITSNGDYYVPRHLKSIKGLPKKKTFKSKYFNIVMCEDILRYIYGK